NRPTSRNRVYPPCRVKSQAKCIEGTRCARRRGDGLRSRRRSSPLRPRRLRRTHHDAPAEAHALDTKRLQTSGPPVALDLRLRVGGVKPLDARSQKIADRAPRRRQQAAGERQTDARVQAPQEAPDRVGWHPEFERGQSPTWAEYARELANSGRWIVHIAQQVGERDVVERLVGERQPLALGANTRATIRGARGEHVSALVQADH